MGTGNQRFAQLDALRAIAVLGVVASHTLNLEREPWAEHGSYGVQLFFVISGFLITGILLDARREAEAGAVPLAGVFRAFYLRRALRIFPLYYLTIAVGTLIGVEGMRRHLGWNLLYLSNWRIAFDGHWGTVTHFWSLAIEEQFYVVWPMVVLLLPRRLLPWAVATMIGVAVATRTVLTATTDMWADGIMILTPSALDSLGLGALLALLWRTPGLDLRRPMAWVGLGALGMFTVQGAFPLVDGLPDPHPVTEIAWPLLFAWVVYHVARGVRGPVGRLLTWRPLAFVGTVSYAVYIFHLFVVPVAEIAEDRWHVDLPIPGTGVARFVGVTAASVALAAVSWSVFERPINNQKRRFPYVVRRDATVPAPAPATAQT